MEVRYPPPPQKGYLSDTCAIPYENKANGCDTPLCDTISKGYCAVWGGISHWAAKDHSSFFSGWSWVSKKRPSFPSENSHFTDDILCFLQASWFVVFPSSVAMLWFMLLFCGSCFVFSLVLWCPSILFLWFADGFPFNVFASLQVVFSFFVRFPFSGLLLYGRIFLACLLYCGSWCYDGCMIGFWKAILAIRVRAAVLFVVSVLGFGCFFFGRLRCACNFKKGCLCRICLFWWLSAFACSIVGHLLAMLANYQKSLRTPISRCRHSCPKIGFQFPASQPK